MAFDRWNAYIASLLDEYRKQPPEERLHFFRDFGRFREFVEELPQAEKIPLLIHAYECYRDVEASDDFDGDRAFWSQAYGILIGRLLAAKLKPSDAEACLILGVACRRIAEGSNLLQPIEVAERAFRNRPYPADLFDSTRAYRETLEEAVSRDARKARKMLDLLLWHDVNRPAKGCWSSRIQRSIAGMGSAEAFAWQWLLRNASPGMWSSGTGKAWSEEGKRRLAGLGEDRFLQRVDEWFSFPGEETVRMSSAGSHYFCLLVLYCGMANRTRTLPILDRLAAVQWSQRGKIIKLVEGLARVILSRQPVP